MPNEETMAQRAREPSEVSERDSDMFADRRTDGLAIGPNQTVKLRVSNGGHYIRAETQQQAGKERRSRSSCTCTREGGGAAKHQKYIAPSTRTKDHGVKDPID